MAAHERKSRGFTLIETLIVVGVIAVLAAVSLPLFTEAIEQSHCAADAAYERAALAYVSSMWSLGKFGPQDKDPGDTWCEYKYYGLSNTAWPTNSGPTDEKYGECKAHKGGRVVVFVCPKCGYAISMWKVNNVNNGQSHDQSDPKQIITQNTNIAAHGCGYTG